MNSMTVIAFDSCWHACSVALVAFDGPEATIFGHRYKDMVTGQAEALPVMLAEVLDQSGKSVQAIDRIAVACGPGSFTGVRIGIAAARAVKLSTRADVVTCSSLHVLALTVSRHLKQRKNPLPNPDHDLVVAMDARRGEVYAQAFAMTPEVQVKTQPQLLPIAEAAKLASTKAMVVVGTAAESVGAAAQRHGFTAHVGDTQFNPDALDLARAARHFEPLSQPLMPLYLRPPDAKPSAKPAIRRMSP